MFIFRCDAVKVKINEYYPKKSRKYYIYILDLLFFYLDAK